MDVEESIRGNPIDGVVLLMGCDKTTPSLLMGASSCDLPTIGVSGGPMLSGWYKGERMAGCRIVEMVKEDLKLSKILTRAAFENAIRVNAAIGGSTNAVIHLIAIARRIG